MLKILLFLLLIFSFNACKTIKTIKVMNQGKVVGTDFKTDIAFETRMKLLVIPVVIKGKTFKFLVDTGAPNLVSKEVAAELGLKTVVTQEAGDSQGNKEKLDFVVIDTIKINDLAFVNTGAVVADLNQSKEIACLDVDGFIGANLMKKAFWQIDYKNKLFTIASSRNKLNSSADQIILPFKPVTSGTPKIEIEYNGVEEENVTFDTGSNGSFTSRTTTYDKIIKEKPDTKTNFGFGRNASGLYGNNANDTTFYALSEVKIGGQTFPDQIVKFGENPAKIMGNEFLQNFTVIIDWSEKKISLIKNTVFEPVDIKGFGFSTSRSENKLLVGFIVVNTDAGKSGLKVGDQITKINGKDYSNLTDELWCDLLYNGLTDKSKNTVDIEVLQEGNTVKFRIQKLDLFK